MAEALDDGEFWLPSEFLTDDDILSDFTNSVGFGSGSGSGSELGSVETESSDDDDLLLLSGLPRQFSNSSLDCPVHSKGCVLSSSPQSTLFSCCSCKGSDSSLGSPSRPVSPPKMEAKKERDGNKYDDENTALDLLKKAACELAKMKMKTMNETGKSSVGTGFFDCSNGPKGILPPPVHPVHFPPYHSLSPFRPFSPQLMWGPVQYPPPLQQHQNTANTNKKSNTTIARPLGLPQSAWPPLPGQPQSQTQQPPTQPQPMMGMYSGQPQTQTQQAFRPPMMGMYAGQPGQKGTGVFLPRRVTPATETKKKSDGNATKTTKTKGSQRRNSKTPKATDEEIQLPSEWVY